MKKVHKKGFIALVMSAILLGLAGIVFAAYTFTRIIMDQNAGIGEIQVSSKKFVNYSAGNANNAKLRKDTVVVIENITLNYTSSYVATEDEIFISGKVYYSDTNGTLITNGEVGSKISDYSGTVYEQVREYTTIAAVGNAYDGSNDAVTCTIDSANNKITCSACVINCTIDSAKGIIKTATSTNSNYKVTISPTGLDLVVLDETITSSTEATISASSAINCSATSKKSHSDYIYLSQLGLEFSFYTEIPVYVRIHIQDAWKRTRNYVTSTRINYILKDQVEGVSPFTVTDPNWYFDAETNYVYLRTMYIPTVDVEGNYNTATFRFDVNEAYYYSSIITSIYTEYIDVEVSFTVDIVQANRADVLWGKDPSTIGV